MLESSSFWLKWRRLGSSIVTFIASHALLKVKILDILELSRNAKGTQKEGSFWSENFWGTQKDWKNENSYVHCLITYMHVHGPSFHH